MTQPIPFIPPGKHRHPCAMGSQLYAYGKVPTLWLSQIAAIVQGFAHRGRAGNHVEYLSDYKESIQKLLAAVRSSELARRPTPRQLYDYCTKANIPLPFHFQSSVLEQVPHGSRKSPRPPITDEFTHPERKAGRPVTQPWFVTPEALHDASNLRPKATRKNFRETRLQGRESTIQQQAKVVALAHVEAHGKMPTGCEIAEQISKNTGRHPSDVRRRFSVKTLLTEQEFDRLKRRYRLSRYDI